MNPENTSLDQLNDLVLPPEVSWWPLAPGWYFVILASAAGLAVLSYQIWKNWRSNAYRRAALRELASAQSTQTIAELLRRTALATTPRRTIAEKTGSAWVDWLGAQSAITIPETIRTQLLSGVYSRTDDPGQLAGLREFAEKWIRLHKKTETDLQTY